MILFSQIHNLLTYLFLACEYIIIVYVMCSENIANRINIARKWLLKLHIKRNINLLRNRTYSQEILSVWSYIYSRIPINTCTQSYTHTYARILSRPCVYICIHNTYMMHSRSKIRSFSKINSYPFYFHSERYNCHC